MDTSGSTNLHRWWYVSAITCGEVGMTTRGTAFMRDEGWTRGTKENSETTFDGRVSCSLQEGKASRGTRTRTGTPQTRGLVGQNGKPSTNASFCTEKIKLCPEIWCAWHPPPPCVPVQAYRGCLTCSVAGDWWVRGCGAPAIGRQDPSYSPFLSYKNTETNLPALTRHALSSYLQGSQHAAKQRRGGHLRNHSR